MESTMKDFARNTMMVGVLAFVAPAAATGCTLEDLNPPPPQTASDKAVALERTRCGPDVDESRLLAVVTGDAVESVEPLYTSAPDAKSGSETRLYGAEIRIRAAQGMTAQWLDRALECHGARRMLQNASAARLASDPFWLPGRMVDIDAQPLHDAFEVSVRGESTDDAQEILIRANAYLASNQRQPHAMLTR
jgi:hypothetical protein